jgi:hypothetical protein
MSAQPIPLGPPPSYNADPAQGLTPYLQLPHLLSLTWLAYPILSLLFVAFRIQLSLDSSQDAIATAKQNLIASCLASEKAATSAASMPRYLALATNEQYADAVNASLKAAGASLIFTLTVMEAIINFLIDIYRSTFLCFVELLIRGGLAIMISAVQEISDFVNSTFSGLRTNIQNDISTANKAIQAAVDGFNKINPFGDVSIPEFSVPSLTALENVTIPTGFEDSLKQLNSSLPSFTDIKEALEKIIDTPFELVKQEINATFSNMTMDPSVLPVPQVNAVTFCKDLDTNVVDDLGRDLVKFAKIGLCIIIALIVLLILGNCALEWYKWRCQKMHLEYTRQAWLTDPTMNHATGTNYKTATQAPTLTMTDHNLLTLQANGSHPLITRITNVLSARLRLSPSKHCNLQWFFNYIFHPPALACFLIGFFGLLAVQLQLLALGPLQSKFTEQSQASAADFSNTIATSINSSMYNQSASYAAELNGQVDLMQNSINDGMFGWVNETTTTLNTTLNEFYDTVQGAVETIFGGTILEQPAQEFIRCLIGSKVDALENALTFLHDNLKVDVPRVNDSVLVLSPQSVDEISKPVALAAIGDGGEGGEGGSGGGLVGKIINAYANSLRKERVMFAIFLGLWSFVVLMALCIIAWHSYGVPMMQERRRRKWQRENEAGPNFIVPYRVGQNFDDRDMEGSRGNARSFTPLPEPKPANAPTARPVLSEKKPSKLNAIGRRAMGREQFVGDAAAGSIHSGDSDASHLGLWSRAMGMFARRDRENEELVVQSQKEEQPRPPLMINVQRASEHAQPSSGWSPDEQPQRSSFAWMKRPASASRNSSSSTNPGIAGIGASGRPKPALTPLAVPLHSHNQASLPPPIHPTRLAQATPSPPSVNKSLAPPSNRHRKNSAASSTDERIAGQLFVVNDNGSILDSEESVQTSTTPLTRLLTTTSARRSSSLNPFATPFDDEHAVRPGPGATERRYHPGPTGAGLRKSLHTNPFHSGVAF